jgi:hypothetical protein
MLLRIKHRKGVKHWCIPEFLVPRTFQEPSADSMDFLEALKIAKVDFFGPGSDDMTILLV